MGSYYFLDLAADRELEVLCSFHSIAFEAEATRSDAAGGAGRLQAPVRQSRPTTWRAVHRCTRLRACVTYRERLSPRSNRDTPESRLRAKSAVVAQGSSR